MKIYPVGVELFYADERTDGRTDKEYVVQLWRSW